MAEGGEIKAEGGEIITEAEEILTVYECPKCWTIIPYQNCPHNCPGDENSEDEAIAEDMEGFIQEISGKTVNIVEAPEPKILELIPDEFPEGQEYQAWHICEEGEEVPEGVTPIRVFETAPGEYRPVQQIIQEAEDIYGPLTELCVKEGG